MNKPLKCYLVDCGQDEGAQLYFSATAGRARAMAASEEGISIIEVSSCVRRPEYDEYAPGPVPPRVLIADGWHFECSGCSRSVYGDEEDDEGNELTTVFDGPLVYCSGVCRAKDKIRDARSKLDDAEMRLMAESAVAARFPGLTVGHCWKPYHRNGPRVQLFLGQLHIADWEVGDTHVWLAPVNAARWNDYQDRLFAPRQLSDWESEGGSVAA